MVSWLIKEVILKKGYFFLNSETLKKLLFFLFFLSILVQVTAQEGSAINILDKQTFKSAIEINPVQLIDVRTSDEYNVGHIAYAVNMDFLNT